MKFIQKGGVREYSIKIVFILYFIFNVIRGIFILDPDFGWILRMGFLILQKGIPYIDPFSFTMPHYPIIAHQWLSEVIIASLYPSAGMVGLSLVFAGAATAALYFATTLVPKKARHWLFVPLFVTACLLADFVSIRPQIFSWFFFSLLIKILFTHAGYHRRWLVLPFLFLAWVNFHGGFAAGVVILQLVVAVRSIVNRKLYIKEAAVALVSILFTFINPYGPRIWQEAWMTITDRSLHLYIIEWQPAIFLGNFLFWVFVAFTVYLVIRYRKKIGLPELSVYVLLLVSALSSMKQIPMFVLFSFPLLTRTLYWLSEEADKVKYGRERLRKLYLYLCILVICLYIPFFISIIIRINLFTEEKFYPLNAITYLQKHYPKGRIFSLYHWSGYLNWKVPEQKIFVSGLMPIWRDHIYPGEAKSAFREYREIIEGKRTLTRAIEQYDITTVLLPVIDQEYDDFNSLKKQTLSKGFKIVYKDTALVIYQRGD